MENTMPLVSVIMPVYNAENDVHIAIDSIINQTYKNWELLVVDDCSTDNTCSIVREYEKQDSRICLLQQEKNAGPGYAKNKGLDKAKGQYVTFCDGDDWLEKDAYEKMLAEADENPDVIIAGFYRDIYNKGNELIEQNLVCSEAFLCLKKEELLSKIPEIDEKRLFSYAWNKLYRAEIIKKFSVDFSDKKFGEDYDFNVDFFAFAEKAVMLEAGVYHYIKKNGESLTERFIPDFFEINKDRFVKMKALMMDNNVYSDMVQQKIMNAYIKHVLAAVSRLYDERGEYTHSERKLKVKQMLSDEMSKEALNFSKATSSKEKACNFIFKTNSITVNMMFGKLLWFMQTKGKKVYERVK